jgi:2-polyprenyl-3-methyl-5-hydroxy-6-metoxy-1,4-benzoquinol methylase
MIKQGRQYGKDTQEIDQKHLERYELACTYAKDKNILDIACGCGYGSYILGQKAKKVIGVDISRDAIKFAKKIWWRTNIEFHIDSMKTIKEYKQFGIDYIVSLETIEHIDQPIELTLKDIYETLNKNGSFFISYPLEESIKSTNHYHCHKEIKKENIYKILENLNVKIEFEKFQRSNFGNLYEFYHLLYCRK